MGKISVIDGRGTSTRTVSTSTISVPIRTARTSKATPNRSNLEDEKAFPAQKDIYPDRNGRILASN